jgi:hypothetical protein
MRIGVQIDRLGQLDLGVPSRGLKRLAVGNEGMTEDNRDCDNQVAHLDSVHYFLVV